jgi:hypothetical protein
VKSEKNDKRTTNSLIIKIGISSIVKDETELSKAQTQTQALASTSTLLTRNPSIDKNTSKKKASSSFINSPTVNCLYQMKLFSYSKLECSR